MPKGFKSLPFDKIKDGIVGKKYELSIVLVGRDKIKSLNRKYRQKNQATDVLSFEVSGSEGEIFICPEVANKKAKKFYPTSSRYASGLRGTSGNYLLFLVIHAIFHLKGMAHGSKMERYELTHYNRYRRRHL